MSKQFASTSLAASCAALLLAACGGGGSMSSIGTGNGDQGGPPPPETEQPGPTEMERRADQRTAITTAEKELMKALDALSSTNPTASRCRPWSRQ